MDIVTPGDEQPYPGPGSTPVDPIVLRMMLGAQLRRFREAANLSPERAGEAIRASRSKISRMETGRVGFKIRDLMDLLDLYSVTDERARSSVLSLARQSAEPDWWAKYSDVLPGWFEPYLGLESAADTIRSFDIQFVHTLFQTEDYARAVIRLGYQGGSYGAIEDQVALRLKRQDLLARREPPRIWAVMDESVLRRPVGGPDVMRAQFHRLMELARMPQVTIQVVGYARSGHAGESGSFSVLRFGERDLPDVVYLEHLTSAIYLEQRPDVEHYLGVMDRLSGQALTPADTRGLIERAAREA
jgi:transcriptional regulator with XRE-family HTH domain